MSLSDLFQGDTFCGSGALTLFRLFDSRPRPSAVIAVIDSLPLDIAPERLIPTLVPHWLLSPTMLFPRTRPSLSAVNTFSLDFVWSNTYFIS